MDLSCSIRVATQTGPCHIRPCLESLFRSTYSEVRIYVVDNGSTDGAPEEAVERYPNVRLLRTGGNLGYGSAVNRAVTNGTLTMDSRSP